MIMPNDPEKLIHKIGRKYILPLFIRLRKLFGRFILLVLFILYPILITLGMVLGYSILLLGSCTFKTFHTILTGSWTPSMYSFPTQLAQLHPTAVCSMSYISSIIIFLILGIFLALLIYIVKYIHGYIKEYHIQGVE